MATRGFQPGALLLAAAAALLVSACGPANERPLRGAQPGGDSAATPPGLPPTLTPSEALRLQVSPIPSPGVAASAGPSPAASPSVVAAPPIVRTIAPSADGHVPAGAVNLSAVLVGRGADLVSASLSVDGADAGAQIDKRSAREWAIHASQPMANGAHTARVLVRDSVGANGGFTWKFQAGEPEAAPPPQPAQPNSGASPVPKPRSP